MSFIKIQCNDCSKTHQIQADEFDFEQVDSSEQQMGPEITYEGAAEIPCNCGKTIEVTHLYWEYPEGELSHKETNVSGCTVIENKL